MKSYNIYKWEFVYISEQLESFHGIRDIHLGVAFAAAIGVTDYDGAVPATAGNAKVELLVQQRVGAEDVDPAAIVGVEELVDGHVPVLRDHREMRLLLLIHIKDKITITDQETDFISYATALVIRLVYMYINLYKRHF